MRRAITRDVVSDLAGLRGVTPLFLDDVSGGTDNEIALLPVADVADFTVGGVVPSQRWGVNGCKAHLRIGDGLDQFV